MAKYIFAFHSGPTPPKPEDMEGVMAKWMAWFGKMGDAVVDGGAPLGQSRTVAASNVSEGGGANPLSGYTIVQADDIEAACEMAKGCPALASGGSVEVGECMPM